MLIKSSRVGLLVLVAWLQAALLACSSGDSSPPKPEQALGSSSVELIRAGDPTVVTAGTPSPRQPTCPGNRLPDLCGSWAGVELAASSGYKKLPPQGKPPFISVPREDAEHCLCQPIEIEVPGVLPVAEGDAGNGKAELKFRKQSGGYVTCRYRGSDHGPPPGGGDGLEYRLDRCDDGLRAGSKVKADWFALEVERANSIFEKTSVALRLGEPDVVDGVVQDTVYYPDDDALLGASLTVPRGAAPAFQDFKLTRLSQFPTATTLENAGTPFTTLGPAVDVQAVGQDAFAFTEVPGASCPRIELPYSRQALENLLGTSAEALLQGRQITDVTAALGGAAALAPVGAITVDLLGRTLSFCTKHLSFYVAGSDQASWNASLVTARLDVTDPNAATLDGTSLLNTPTLPTLTVGSVHTLTLEFQNTSTNNTSWSEGTAPRLVSVGSWATGPATDAVSAWFPDGSGAATQFSRSVWDNSNGPFGTTNSLVPPTQRARFTFQITAPPNGSLLNLCLAQGSNRFGTCFSWYPSDLGQQNGSTIIAGQLTRPCYTGPAVTRGVGRCKDGQQTSLAGGGWPPATSCPGQVLPAAEICNTINDDCDNETDENVKNACGGCTPLPDYGQDCPFTDGTCTVTGHQDCDGQNATKCVGSIVRNECGGCAALPNFGQDCPVTDGTCTATGRYQCDGQEATTCVGSVTRNACNGCSALSQTIGSDCSNGCPGHWQCDGTEGVTCDAVLPPNYGGQCGCGGIGIMGCNGCSAPECRRVILRMNNVDDNAYAWIGPPQWQTEIFGGLTPVGYVCHASHGSNLGNLDCDITDAVLSSFSGDYRAVPITIKLSNSGCFATEGRFRLEVVETDGSIVDYALSTQSNQPLVHCGWVHRHYFELNLVDGGAPSWPDVYPYCFPIPDNPSVHDVDCSNPAACVNDGDCFL